MTYQLTQGNTVIKDGYITISLADTPEFPNTNEYYLEYQEWLAAGNTPLPADIDPVAIKKQLFAELTAEYEDRMSFISGLYPDSERESWGIQIEEARALITDSEAVTPWITSAALTRGVDKLEMANKILAKNANYRGIHGAITGVRQQKEDLMDAAGTDVSKLLLIDIKADWPEISAT